MNASPHEKRADYLPCLVDPSRTRTLFGPEYAILRPELAEVRTRTNGRPVRRILACFGGGDDCGGIHLTLDALADRPPQGVELRLVSGRLNPRLAAMIARVAHLRNVELHVDPGDIAALLRDSDLAVTGGGTMSYEAAICGVPMVLMAVAPNQVNSCLSLCQRGYLAPVNGKWEVVGFYIRGLSADQAAQYLVTDTA